MRIQSSLHPLNLFTCEDLRYFRKARNVGSLNLPNVQPQLFPCPQHSINIPKQIFNTTPISNRTIVLIFSPLPAEIADMDAHANREESANMEVAEHNGRNISETYEGTFYYDDGVVYRPIPVSVQYHASHLWSSSL